MAKVSIRSTGPNMNLQNSILRTIFLLLVCLAAPQGAFSQQDIKRPITGEANAKFAAFDPVVEKHMDHIGATAASFAVSINGKIVYSRAYGWADKDMQVPATPETTFRLASNTKPITAAIVRQVIPRTKGIDFNTKVFEYLEIEPMGGKLGDERLNDITIDHLLRHRGGWDLSKSFDPTYRAKTISKAHGIKVEDLTKKHVVQYMLAEPLQNEPGAKHVYSNFGYLLLGMVIEKATGNSYAENVAGFVKKMKLEDIHLSSTNAEDRRKSEVFYPRESGFRIRVGDSVGGLAGTAESLCQFMKKYWTSGKRRKRNDSIALVHYGRHVRCTNALMVYRKDRIDYVLLFNSTNDKDYMADLKAMRKDINDTIEQIKRSK